MKIDSDMLYGPCPCGSGKKFKFCCWQKCRDSINSDMTRAEIVQIVRCEAARANLAASDVRGNAVDDEDCVEEEVPKGVTAEKDDENTFFPKPKWRMEYEPRKDGTPEEDAKAIIEGLVRPYAERHCSLADHEDGEDFVIAVMQMHHQTGKNISICPSVVLGKYSQFWDVLYAKLKEFFTYFCDAVYMCEVKFDSSCGGPILMLDDGSGLKEVIMVSIPDRFSEVAQ